MLCAYDGSFAAGLLEAVAQAVVEDRPVLLIAYDTDYPEPLFGARPLPDTFGVALLVSPRPGSADLGRIPSPASLRPKREAENARCDVIC